MSKKILVTEQIAQEGIDALIARGYDVDVRLDLSEEELVRIIEPYEALIVRSATKVTPELMDAAPHLKIIGRAGVTVDTIDIEAANERGIIVCNAPSSNIISAAEHTMALLLAACRNIPQANASVHSGSWARHMFMGVELYGKCLAIFGLGRIGSLVAERARAFGMEVIAYDPYCSHEKAAEVGARLYDNIDDILPCADFITVHLPLTPDTLGMFGPNEFAKMKTGVILVNAARGGIYQVDSLADFLAAGKIAACAIDVFEEEPVTESPLHAFDNAILTPHISAVTKEAQVRAGEQIAEYVWAGLEGSIVPTAINATNIASTLIESVRPYIPASRIIGSMLSQLLDKLPNSVSIQLEGTLSQADPAPLVSGVIDGILAYKHAGAVSLDDSIEQARRHGITVKESTTENAQGCESVLRATADGKEIAFTLFGIDRLPRLVSFLGYKIDIAPAKKSLIFEYIDSPGRIGTIGTILGDAGVNITTMQIGTKPQEKCALVYMNIEGDVSPEVIEQLKEAMVYKDIWQISL